jgi:hypothetical protein
MIDVLRRRKTVAPDPKTADAAAGDGLIRVSIASLLALHHGAETLSLQPHRVRALTGGGYLSPF